MTTLENRPNTALLVVDVQNGVVEGAHERDAVVANVGSLVEKARRERVPVVWVQHSDEELARGSDDWRIVPELTPGDAEPLVEKNYGDSFEDTTLETVLSDLGVGRLVVVGAQTDACIRSTLHGAFVRGYDATLVSDAHTTEDQTAWGAPPPDQVIAHTNLYWTYQTAPGRTAGTVETKDVDFGLAGAPDDRALADGVPRSSRGDVRRGRPASGWRSPARSCRRPRRAREFATLIPRGVLRVRGRRRSAVPPRPARRRHRRRQPVIEPEPPPELDDVTVLRSPADLAFGVDPTSSCIDIPARRSHRRRTGRLRRDARSGRR